MKTLLKALFSISFLVFCSTLSFAQNLAATVQANTSCGTPNGSASASVDGQTQDYSFKWYQGPDGSGTLLATQPVAVNLSGGTYSVTATHNVTAQVLGPIAVMVADNTVSPVVTVQVLSHVTGCPSPNGALRAHPSPGTSSNYTYKWYQGTLIQGTPISTSQTLSNKPAGVYTVVVRHKVTLCETIAAGTIQDLSAVGGISVQVLSPVTTCMAPDGALTVMTNNAPASSYSYQWYAGTTTTGPVISLNQSVFQLAADTYTVVVTHNVTQCNVTISTVVPDARLIPDVSVVVQSNETSCAAPNGSLLAVLASGDPADYVFAWFDEPTMQGPPVAYGPEATQLAAGTYTLMVVGPSQCETVVSAVVTDERISPVVNINVISNETSCTTPDGALQAVVNGPVAANTYKWYQGIAGTGPVIAATDIASNLSAGMYSVEVTDIQSQCLVIASSFVQDVKVMPNAYVQVLSNDTSCTTDPNGHLKAIVWPGHVFAYTYAWYEGWPSASPALSVYPEAQGLSAGMYTVVITHQVTGCEVWVSQDVMYDCQQDFLSARSGESVSMETEQDTPFSYYPNPTTGMLSINGGPTAGYIVLSDRNGNVIHRQNLPPSGDSFSIDIAGQPAGIYVLTFHSGVRTASYQVMKK